MRGRAARETETICLINVEAQLSSDHPLRWEKRSTETHASTTDPEAKLVKHSEGDATKLRYAMHAASENRNGLLVLLDVKQAVGERCAEHETVGDQMDELTYRGFNVKTVGADKGYHTKAFGNFRKSRWIGAEKTHFVAQFVGSAWNLIRMSKLALAEANLPL